MVTISFRAQVGEINGDTLFQRGLCRALCKWYSVIYIFWESGRDNHTDGPTVKSNREARCIYCCRFNWSHPVPPSIPRLSSSPRVLSGGESCHSEPLCTQFVLGSYEDHSFEYHPCEFHACEIRARLFHCCWLLVSFLLVGSLPVRTMLVMSMHVGSILVRMILVRTTHVRTTLVRTTHVRTTLVSSMGLMRTTLLKSMQLVSSIVVGCLCVPCLWVSCLSVPYLWGPYLWGPSLWGPSLWGPCLWPCEEHACEVVTRTSNISPRLEQHTCLTWRQIYDSREPLMSQWDCLCLSLHKVLRFQSVPMVTLHANRSSSVWEVWYILLINLQYILVF